MLCQLSYPGFWCIDTCVWRSGLQLYREASHPGLDLGVAVRAQQHALSGLGAQGIQGEGHTFLTERDPLLARIDVMKLERADIPTIAADPAASSGVVTRDRLHFRRRRATWSARQRLHR